ncbi:putative archaeal coiled-coil protein [Desulfovibrio sp. DV]|uniref:cell division protein ZapB n=1 Tax=Desulfovibrio sp. DV TaxID=1844708 RepID=UPI00094BB94D|nr:cell division protein ZapB [Desulfovibrio sp. DV]OLN30431.1 putative archaeal coiled-coil protein [Desulfovibrio sp. DV]
MPLWLNKWVWAALAALVACALAFGTGYRTGFEKADAARRAEVAELSAQAETWKTEQAKAWAEAERKAREELEAATNRVNALAGKLDRAKRESTAKIKDITRRIPRATAGLTCNFGPDFVRLYNEAIGAAGRAGGGAMPEAGAAAAVAGAPDAAPAVGPGLRPVRAVTPADILAHIRDFGARSQDMEAQLDALIDLVTDNGGR